MPFSGTIVNVITVLLGSGLGLLAGDRLPERYKQSLLNCLGLGTLFIGFAMAMKTSNNLLIIGSLIVGAIIGEMLHLEAGLDRLGERLRRSVGADSPNFATGFVTATLLFCVGPMTFVGSLQDGMGDGRLIYIKATLDGFSSLALSSALGIGVMFSAGSVLIIQGALALVGMYLGQMAAPAMMTELSAVGGLIIIAIGINLLGLKKIPVANFLPALGIVPLALWVMRIMK